MLSSGIYRKRFNIVTVCNTFIGFQKNYTQLKV